MTGFFRDGCCRTGPEDLGSHTICAVVTAEFLEHQREHRQRPDARRCPQYRFPGLEPGDRWCVTAAELAARPRARARPPTWCLAATHERALDIVSLEILREHAVDVPGDAGALSG